MELDVSGYSQAITTQDNQEGYLFQYYQHSSFKHMYTQEQILCLRGVAIKKPDLCSTPLLKKSDNRNVIPFNVVPSPIPTPLHANLSLLGAVLQVILCYAVQELRRFCFHCIHGLKPGSFERRLDFREEENSHGARSGEYGGCSITGMLFFAKYLFKDSALCAGALSC